MDKKARIISVLRSPRLGKSITGFDSFELSKLDLPDDLDFDLPTNLRLGHLVERIVSQCIQASANYSILGENIQLIEKKSTIGEIDFILEEQESKGFYHLELAYKFYLYDPSVSDDPIQNWIGPNRNDSLHLKLYKLREKQFPLLNHKFLSLPSSALGRDDIKQVLCFLASLFLPYQKEIDIPASYQKAVQGYYLSFEDFCLMDHELSSYYMPPKREWGIDPSENENWSSYDEIESELFMSIKEKQSRMCWKKYRDTYKSFFIVWWQ